MKEVQQTLSAPYYALKGMEFHRSATAYDLFIKIVALATLVSCIVVIATDEMEPAVVFGATVVVLAAHIGIAALFEKNPIVQNGRAIAKREELQEARDKVRRLEGLVRVQEDRVSRAKDEWVNKKGQVEWYPEEAEDAEVATSTKLYVQTAHFLGCKPLSDDLGKTYDIARAQLALYKAQLKAAQERLDQLEE